MIDPISTVGLLLVAYLLLQQLRKRLPGFYRRYLNSRKWKRRRKWCLALGRWRCRACRRPAVQAHHASYRFLASITPIELIDLVPLCHRCHRGAHGIYTRMKTMPKWKLQLQYGIAKPNLRVATNHYIQWRKNEEIAA